MCLKVKIDSFYIIILKKYCDEYLKFIRRYGKKC